MELTIIGEYYIDRIELSQVYHLNEKQVNILCDKIDYYELTDSDLNRINTLVGLTCFIESDAFLVSETDETQLEGCTNFYINEHGSELTNRLPTRYVVIDLSNGTKLAVSCK